jgi:hypothetical protein
MREKKAPTSTVLVAAVVAFSFPQALWAAEQAGRHHARHRGGAVWGGSVAGARAPGVAAPYYYGPGGGYGFGAASSSITNFPYGPYGRSSGGCCHGRN